MFKKFWKSLEIATQMQRIYTQTWINTMLFHATDRSNMMAQSMRQRMKAIDWIWLGNVLLAAVRLRWKFENEVYSRTADQTNASTLMKCVEKANKSLSQWITLDSCTVLHRTALLMQFNLLFCASWTFEICHMKPHQYTWDVNRKHFIKFQIENFHTQTFDAFVSTILNALSNTSTNQCLHCIDSKRSTESL